MNRIHNTLLMTTTLLSVGTMTAHANGGVQKEIFALNNQSSTGHIIRFDLTNNTRQDTGDTGVGLLTNLAMTEDRTLYFANPFDGTSGNPGHSLYKATLTPTNTLTGVTFVAQLPTSGLGIIDGFTAIGNDTLIMTGYGKSEIYRYTLSTNTFVTAVKLTAPAAGGPAGEFRSDIAFDPITGNLVGLGIEPGTNHRKLFQIPQSLVLTGTNNLYNWQYFGGAASAWATRALEPSNELGANPDGIAFDPTNGDLFLSGDGDGVHSYNRTTSLKGASLVASGADGWDLAFQTTVVPSAVPEPGIMGLLIGSGVGAGFLLRRRRK